MVPPGEGVRGVVVVAAGVPLLVHRGVLALLVRRRGGVQEQCKGSLLGGYGGSERTGAVAAWASNLSRMIRLPLHLLRRALVLVPTDGIVTFG